MITTATVKHQLRELAAQINLTSNHCEHISELVDTIGQLELSDPDIAVVAAQRRDDVRAQIDKIDAVAGMLAGSYAHDLHAATAALRQILGLVVQPELPRRG